ncbi:hypothetical protein AgCh_035924 [Apium graveolens]
MFYFFFESRNSKKDPVVIWLPGGPGCSSELALFYEYGHFCIAKNMSLMWKEYGRDKVSNLLYVDQPTGTGFSYSSDKRDIRHNEYGVSNDLYDFLQGFSIGNGLTNPDIQYKAYSDYAPDNSIIKKSNYERINKVLPDIAVQAFASGHWEVHLCDCEKKCVEGLHGGSLYTLYTNVRFDVHFSTMLLKSWLIENHGFQPHAVSELNEKGFWKMFDAELYKQCRRKYGAVS